jgi:hypothetical protein
MGPPMSKTEFLIDQIYRSCFDKRAPKPGLRRALESARRFVLDDAMAAFLGELSFESFTGRHLHIKPHRRAQHIYSGIDSLRHFSRLPHKVTWVEYPITPAAQRRTELTNKFGSCVFIGSGATYQPDAFDEFAEWREGWLLWQHERIDTAFGALIFTGGLSLFSAHAVALMWDTEDNPLPWRQLHSGTASWCRRRRTPSFVASAMREFQNRNPRSPPPTLATLSRTAGASASVPRARTAQPWIPEHQRGDASLGFVTHDYEVTHDKQAAE